MPRVIVSVNFEVGDKTAVLQGITDAVAGTLGKPANAHMVVLHTGAAISVGGTQDPAACIDLQTVTQLDSTLNKKLSAVLAEVGEAQLGVSPTRMYINFTQLQPSHWGKSGVLLEEILQQQSKQES